MRPQGMIRVLALTRACAAAASAAAATPARAHPHVLAAVTHHACGRLAARSVQTSSASLAESADVISTLTLEEVARLDAKSLRRELEERGLSRSGKKFLQVLRLAKDVATRMSSADISALAQRYGIDAQSDRDAIAAAVVVRSSPTMSDSNFTAEHQRVCETYAIDIPTMRAASKRHPKVLEAILSNTRTLADVYASKYAVQDFGLVISEEPRVLLLSPEMFSVIIDAARHNEEEALGVGVKIELIARFATAFLDNNKQPDAAVAEIARALGASQEAANEVVQRLPALLAMGGASIAEKATAFKRLFFLSDSQFLRVLRNNPRVLTYSSSTLERKIQTLNKILGLSDDMLGPMIVSLPSFISLSPDALEQRSKFVRSYLELTDEEAQHIFRHYMGILSLHIERNLKPKLDFLVNVCGFMKHDIKLYPFVLKHGLWSRIIPRYDLFVKHNLPFTMGNMTLSNLRMDALLNKEPGYTSNFHASWKPENSLIKERPEYKQSFLRKPKKEL